MGRKAGTHLALQKHRVRQIPMLSSQPTKSWVKCIIKGVGDKSFHFLGGKTVGAICGHHIYRVAQKKRKGKGGRGWGFPGMPCISKQTVLLLLVILFALIRQEIYCESLN